MANDVEPPFSDKFVCVVLVEHGLIDKEQALEVFEKKEKARENIEKQKGSKHYSNFLCANA
jgi:hypothetical protein